MSHQSMHNRAPTTIPLCPYQVGCACSPPRLKICEPLTVSKIVYPATFGNIVFWFFLILLRLKCFDNYPCIGHLSFNTFYHLWVKRFDFLLVDCTYQFFFFHSPSLDVAYCSWLFVVLVTCLFFLFLVFLPPHLGISSLFPFFIYLRPPTRLRTRWIFRSSQCWNFHNIWIVLFSTKV